MAIVKEVAVDKVEKLLDSGVVQVRTRTRIIESGVVISESFHRHTIAPGEDYSGETPEVQAECALIHTPEKIAQYQAAQAAALAAQ